MERKTALHNQSGQKIIEKIALELCSSEIKLKVLWWDNKKKQEVRYGIFFSCVVLILAYPRQDPFSQPSSQR